MAQYWLCKLGSLELVQLVESEEDLDNVVHSSKGASNEMRYFELPEGVYSSNCKLILNEVDPDNPYHELIEDVSSQDNNPEWIAVKKERDEKLAASDWTQLPDSPLDTTPKQNWAVYRTALRDIPQDFDEVESVEWPEEPS